MAKYRKKPVVIEAMQFTNETKDRVFNWITTTCYPGFDESNNPVLVVQTLEGDMRVSLGDWVIKGVKGEFYPCKADIFEATYEAVEDTQPVDFWEQYGITRNLQLVEARAELEALRAQAQPSHVAMTPERVEALKVAVDELASLLGSNPDYDDDVRKPIDVLRAMLKEVEG